MGFAETNSLAILATFLLLSTTATAAPRKNLASSLCEGADDGSLCTDMSKGAKNWPEAMANMIDAFIEKVEAGRPIAYGVGAKLPGHLSAESKQSIASTCKDMYEALLSGLEECKGFIKNDPTSSLKVYLSSTTFSECRTVLQQFEVSMDEVNEFDDELVGISSNLLAVVEKNPKYVNV